LLLPIGYLDIGLKQVGGEMVQEFGDAVFADGAEEVSLGELSQGHFRFLILEFRFETERSLRLRIMPAPEMRKQTVCQQPVANCLSE